MENDYLAHFESRQAIYRYLFCGVILLLIAGLPMWFYIDSFLETNGIGIDNLGVERYNERIADAIKVTLLLLGIISVVGIPALIFINRFFDRYHMVLQRLTSAEVVTLKTISDAVQFGKYMPSFIITSQNLFVFAMELYMIPFNQITSHKFTLQHGRSGVFYKVEINTSDGKYYNFRISSNQIQLEQLKLHLVKPANFQ